MLSLIQCDFALLHLISSPFVTYEGALNSFSLIIYYDDPEATFQILSIYAII